MPLLTALPRRLLAQRLRALGAGMLLDANDRRVIEHGERGQDEEVNRSADGKLERSYLSVKLPLRDMLNDPQDASIIRDIITKGESRHLDVIAEDVELPAQRDALFAMGCRQFQGFLFGKPVPLPALTQTI